MKAGCASESAQSVQRAFTFWSFGCRASPAARRGISSPCEQTVRYNQDTVTTRFLAAALCLAIVPVAAAPRPPRVPSQAVDICNIQTPERIVAIGDVHGSFDNFVAILRVAGLIDNRRQWAGGKTVFVQTGDVLDRGPASREAMDLLRKLEKDAPAAGGLVLPLLGNHEVMRIVNDRRYISAGEYNAFKGPESNSLRDRAYEFLAAENSKRAKAAGEPFDAREFRKLFYDQNPPGAVEMQIAFGPEGDYGRWVRDRKVVARVNGVVFLHGGLTPEVAALGCEGINRGAQAELQRPMPPIDPAKALITSPDGPLWYRGLIDDGATAGPADESKIDAALKAIDARAIVVGHTVTPDYRIRPSSRGRIIQIDTGMLGGEFFPGGRPSALEITGPTWTAIYQDGRQPISRGPWPLPPPPPVR